MYQLLGNHFTDTFWNILLTVDSCATNGDTSC